MKKLILTFSAVAITLAAAAQVKVGVQGGVAANTAKVSSLANPKNYTSPTFGVIMQANMGPLLFRPSVNYVKTGSNFSSVTTAGGVTTTQNDELRVGNIEVPLDITVPVKMKSGRLLLSLAPVITVGVDATVATNYSVSSGTPPAASNLSLNFGNSAGEIKKVDWGTRFGLGYEFKGGLQLNAGYKLGLSDQDNNTGSTYKNHYLSLTAAYFLFK